MVPDPSGRHELRFWDGGQWTQHVTSQGHPGIDLLVSGPAVPTADKTSKKVLREVRRAGVAAGGQIGGGTLFTEPVLVVSQKAKLLEINAEYAVYDQRGRQIGAVREVGQSFMKKALAVRPEGQRTHRLQVVDMDGRVVIALTRPARIVRSKVIVRDGEGVQIGEIAQKSFGIMGKIRFVLEAGGRTVGSINAESSKAWDFNIEDTAGDEIARITKTWAGLAKEMFTRGDNYVVQIHRPLDEPLRSLVISAALAVDTVLEQGGARHGRL
ncbi:phospholipid scramblase-related protein [Geodermatophilus sp. SYSU D00691]